MPRGKHIPWTTGHLMRMREMRNRGASYQGIAAALFVYENIDTGYENVRTVCRNNGFAPKHYGDSFGKEAVRHD